MVGCLVAHHGKIVGNSSLIAKMTRRQSSPWSYNDRSQLLEKDADVDARTNQQDKNDSTTAGQVAFDLTVETEYCALSCLGLDVTSLSIWCSVFSLICSNLLPLDHECPNNHSGGERSGKNEDTRERMVID